MDLPVCKCCGQTLPGALEFAGTRLTPQQMRIVDRIQRGGKHGITMGMLIQHVYANDPNGGAVTAENVMYVQIAVIKKRLKAAPFNIACNKRGGSAALYRITST
jgi:hypothetical protein